MIDAELVTRKMVLITADLKALAPLALRPLEDYIASATDKVLVERYLERIIGRMIDINYHLITEAGVHFRELTPTAAFARSRASFGKSGVAGTSQ